MEHLAFDIKDFMKAFHVEIEPEDKREFIFYTGQAGAKMFHHTFEVMVIILHCKPCLLKT
jgi:hypothetical protein